MNANVAIDLTAPIISLDNLDINLGLPVITGTCLEPEGTEVRVTLTDFLGIAHTLTATIGIGGLFTVIIPVTVADGDALAEVSITDIAGNETIVNANVAIDLTAPLLTLAPLDVSNILTGPLLTGACSEPTGTVITISVSAVNLATIELQATVDEFGYFSLQLAAGLPGLLDITASVTDLAGNTTTVSNSYDILGNILDVPSEPADKSAYEVFDVDEIGLNFPLESDEKIDLTFNTQISDSENTDSFSVAAGDDTSLIFSDLISESVEELLLAPQYDGVVNANEMADASHLSESPQEIISASYTDLELIKSLIQSNNLSVDV